MDTAKTNFLRLIDRHQGIITSLCKIYYKTPDDQRDARQEVILQLWKSYPSFRNESAISTWIYRVSLNTILGNIKKEKKWFYSQSINALHENQPGASSSSDDDLQLLSLIIQSLKETDKAIIILYLEGYKNPEIAEILGLTATNISTRLNRIKAALKIKYQTFTYEPK